VSTKVAGSAEAAEEGRKPPFWRWCIVWGVITVIALLIASYLVGVWRTIERRAEVQRELNACSAAAYQLADWLKTYWDQHKALPPADSVPVAIAKCPLGHCFEYVGDRDIVIVSTVQDGDTGESFTWRQRVLVIETEPHEPSGRGVGTGAFHHAVVAPPAFLAAGKSTVDFERNAPPLAPGAEKWSGYPFFEFTITMCLVEDYAKIRTTNKGKR
jgi:hypothetical protein